MDLEVKYIAELACSYQCQSPSSEYQKYRIETWSHSLTQLSRHSLGYGSDLCVVGQRLTFLQKKFSIGILPRRHSRNGHIWLRQLRKVASVKMSFIFHSKTCML